MKTRNKTQQGTLPSAKLLKYGQTTYRGILLLSILGILACLWLSHGNVATETRVQTDIKKSLLRRKEIKPFHGTASERLAAITEKSTALSRKLRATIREWSRELEANTLFQPVNLDEDTLEKLQQQDVYQEIALETKLFKVSADVLDQVKTDSEWVNLPLPDGQEYLTSIESRQPFLNNGVTTYGELLEHPGSHVILSAYENALAGMIYLPGGKTYEIRMMGNGLHAIYELDQHAAGGCLTCSPADTKENVEEGDAVPSFSSKYRNWNRNHSDELSFQNMNLRKSTSRRWDMFERLRTYKLKRRASTIRRGGHYASERFLKRQNASAIIDVLILWTPETENDLNGVSGCIARAGAMVGDVNQILENSNTFGKISVNLVGARRYEGWSDSGNYREALSHIRADKGVAQLRDRYGADLVSLMVSTPDSKIGGVANLLTKTGGNPEFAFTSVLRHFYAISNHTFAHELGHNFGFCHNWDQYNGYSCSNAVYPMAHGHRFQGANALRRFRTIMSYSKDHTVYDNLRRRASTMRRGGYYRSTDGVIIVREKRIPYFSNPRVSFDGTPTGIPGKADNANVISLTAKWIEKYRIRPKLGAAPDS